MHSGCNLTRLSSRASMRQDISVEVKGEEESESIQNREVSVRLGRRVPNHQRIQNCRLNKVKSILGNLTQDLTWRIMIFNFQDRLSRVSIKILVFTEHAWLRNNFTPARVLPHTGPVY